MKIPNMKAQLPVILALGSVWGLMEAGIGMFLRGSCAHMTTGSIMTGVAILFFSASMAYSSSIWSVGILFLTATVYKLIDAFLLHLPILHGAIANPIFGFLTEALGFLFILFIIQESLKTKRYGQMILGGTSALVAVNLFPLVKFATGIPACVYPGTQQPLALYFALLAVLISVFTCPIGFAIGQKLAEFQSEQNYKLSRVPAYSLSIVSLAALFVLRLG